MREFADNDGPSYRPSSELQVFEFVNACCSFKFFEEDIFLKMQANNIALIDKYITDLEEICHLKWLEEERLTFDFNFLSAQTQMWIFALYEVFRTWRAKVRSLIELSKSNKLGEKIDLYKAKGNIRNVVLKIRQKHIEDMVQDDTIVKRLKDDLLRSEMFFTKLSEIRMPLAKHEVNKPSEKKLLSDDIYPQMPGYSRINRYSGSLEYEIGSGTLIFGYISRRDIADEVRLLINGEVPTEEEVKGFKKAINGIYE